MMTSMINDVNYGLAQMASWHWHVARASALAAAGCTCAALPAASDSCHPRLWTREEKSPESVG